MYIHTIQKQNKLCSYDYKCSLNVFAAKKYEAPSLRPLTQNVLFLLKYIFIMSVKKWKDFIDTDPAAG